MRKKIMVLFCGGTIAMVQDEKGLFVLPKRETALNSLFSLVPGIEKFADLDLHFISNNRQQQHDSSDLGSNRHGSL